MKQSLFLETGMNLSEKFIRRFMKEENLIVRLTKTKKYNSYKGEISPSVPNVLNHDFTAS